MRIWKAMSDDVEEVRDFCNRANHEFIESKVKQALEVSEEPLSGVYFLAEGSVPLIGIFVEPWQKNIGITRVAAVIAQDTDEFHNYLKQFFIIFLHRYKKSVSQPLFCLTDLEQVKAVALEVGFEVFREILHYRKPDFTIPEYSGLPIKIREFRSDDLAGLLAIEHAVFMPEVWNDREMFIKMAEDKCGRLFVAEFMHQVVGYNYNYLREDGSGHVARLGIHEDYQGLGIGKQMMINAINWFKAESAKTITLDVRRENLKARVLYDKLGFSEEGLEYRLRYGEGGN